MKRIFDILSSGLGLLLLSPLFILLSIWIKMDSEGPVFFKQTRVGRYNRNFTLLKFRTMYMGSDKKGFITIGDRDPRVTNSGYFIRKFKLDELPQLINVFLGDMSLVGPRPEVRHYVEMYNDDQLIVLTIRPGITDMASIKYRNENELLEFFTNPEQYYREVIMQDKLRINMEYIQKSNFWFDIKLILKTFIEIVK